jgi:hypothetical protein
MKTLIDVERNTWGKVKEFATIRQLSLSLAVDQLLKHGLAESGHRPGEGERRE